MVTECLIYRRTNVLFEKPRACKYKKQPRRFCCGCFCVPMFSEYASVRKNSSRQALLVLVAVRGLVRSLVACLVRGLVLGLRILCGVAAVRALVLGAVLGAVLAAILARIILCTHVFPPFRAYLALPSDIWYIAYYACSFQNYTDFFKIYCDFFARLLK